MSSSPSGSSSIAHEAKKTSNNVLNGVKGVVESRSAMGVAPLTPVFGVKDCKSWQGAWRDVRDVEIRGWGGRRVDDLNVRESLQLFFFPVFRFFRFLILSSMHSSSVPFAGASLGGDRFDLFPRWSVFDVHFSWRDECAWRLI